MVGLMLFTKCKDNNSDNMSIRSRIDEIQIIQHNLEKQISDSLTQFSMNNSALEAAVFLENQNLANEVFSDFKEAWLGELNSNKYKFITYMCYHWPFFPDKNGNDLNISSIQDLLTKSTNLVKKKSELSDRIVLDNAIAEMVVCAKENPAAIQAYLDEFTDSLQPIMESFIKTRYQEKREWKNVPNVAIENNTDSIGNKIKTPWAQKYKLSPMQREKLEKFYCNIIDKSVVYINTLRLAVLYGKFELEKLELEYRL